MLQMRVRQVLALSIVSMTLLGLVLALPVAAQSGPPYSDDFHWATLDPVWTWVNPLGDCSYSIVGTGTEDAWVQISVPGGTVHGLWGTVTNVCRIVQPADNTDWEIEVKFESGVSVRYETQGVIIQEESVATENLLNYLRFNFHSTGSNTVIFAASFANGSLVSSIGPTTVAANGAAPLYMRVTRSGNNWAMSSSTDGQNWTPRGNFDHILSVAAVAVYGGNEQYLSNPIPAHTASVDYIFNTDSPIDPEDGGALAVDLVSFTATPADGGVLLEWETATEVDTLGFHLLRSDAADGDPLRLTEDLVRSQELGSPVGAQYSFVDQTARPGVTYYYWLEDVDLGGAITSRGPVSATADNYRLYLPLVYR